MKYIEKIRQEKVAKEKRKLKGKKINKLAEFEDYIAEHLQQEHVHCNCKKNCDLKYCKCRQANQACNSHCKCTDCRNLDGNEEFQEDLEYAEYANQESLNVSLNVA